MGALSASRAAARLRWRLRRWAGLPGVGPLLLVLALAALLASAAWWARAGERLQGARVLPARATPAAALGGADLRRQQLAQFIDRLPAADDVPTVVQSLLDGAERQGLRLPRGSYRLQPEQGARFARYRMSLPVRGEPARVQRFIEAALLAWPTLAVESIQFKRDTGAERALEARIQWVLFVRAESPGGAAAARAAGPGS